ncbi:MAG: amidohydrolase family protein [Proteobacteria bacterium]|nr:amidohydrolase family protein [Pseudomonadota bacterium]
MTKLTVCGLMDNDEAHIERFFHSLRNVVDEVILGDLGCTDKTTEIAKRFNAKIITIPKDADFSQARNLLLEKATSDWILILDADEIIHNFDLQPTDSKKYRLMFMVNMFHLTSDEIRNVFSDVQDVLAQKAAATPPGEWVRGFMYDDTKFEEERALNLRDLDDAVPNHPVYVAHRGGHTIVVNSKAFEVAGIDRDTPDPVGGKFYREDGEFTGKVAEYATRPFRLLAIPQVDRAQLMQSAILSSKAMAAAGLTSTTDAGCNRDRFVAYNDARDAGELAFRISVMPRGGEFYDGLKKAGVSSGFGDDMIRIGAAKFGADGSASERTMYMSTPYEGTDDHGILTMTQEQIDDAVDDAVAHGFRVGIHANGDWTIDMVLKAYERVLKNHQGPNPRHRIEHCSLINDSLLARIKAAGVVPTPFYTYAHYHGNKWVDYGEEKMESMFAHRSFLDAGIPVAPASDYGPGPYEPMMAIQSMVTRKDMRGRVWGPSQRISVTEAMRICTMHGAYASFEENIKGSLEAGKLADFVILEQDPHEVDPDTIKEIRIIQTVMGGLTTYEA